MTPGVSVVIAAFNAGSYLGDAIESVLSQTRAPLELVVVDDGSQDETAEVALRFGDAVRFERQRHAGVSAALNRGTALTRGDHLAFLDADDLWAEDKLALQLEALEREQLDMVFGHVDHFHSPELADDQRARIALPAAPVRGICRGAMVIRREAFMHVGSFATEWTLGEFLDWYARALDTGLTSSVLPEVVMHRRLHAANTSFREPAGRSDFPRILKTVLDRRRAAST